MKIKWALVFGALMFLSSVISEHVHAQVKHIKIEDQLDPSPIARQYIQLGNWTVQHTAGPNFTCASGTGKTYTISGSPIVDAFDTSPDIIRFHGATITANNNGVCGHIYFWAKMLPGPAGTVDFDLSSAGSLKRGAGGATGSWVHFSGWVQHPATAQGEVDGIFGTWEHVGSLNGPPASRAAQDKHATAAAFAFPPPNAIDENPDLLSITNARIMKGEIWFLLATSGDQLLLNAGSGVQVTTAAGGGGDDGGGGGIDPHDITDPHWRDSVIELLDEAVAERLRRLEKHLQLPPFPKPIPPDPLNEEKILTEPSK